MVIVINTIFLAGHKEETDTKWVFDCFAKMAELHTGNTFIFLATKDKQQLIPTAANCTSKILKVQKKVFSFNLWLNFRLPVFLKKNMADILFSSNCIGSKGVKIPQIVLLNNPDLKQPSKSFPKIIKYFSKTYPDILQLAQSVITNAFYTKNQIIDLYRIPSNKIEVIQQCSSNFFQAADWNEKEKIKEIYTEENDYFLWCGNDDEEHQVLEVLKAFSIFKRKQKSNMKMVLVFKQQKDPLHHLTLLEHYKYKADVICLNEPEEKIKKEIFTAAYAFVSMSITMNALTTMLEAAHCNLPLIVNNNSVLREWLGNAALYTHTENKEEIAGHMMTLFKDENKRLELINTNKKIFFPVNHSAGKCWDIIQALHKAK